MHTHTHLPFANHNKLAPKSPTLPNNTMPSHLPFIIHITSNVIDSQGFANNQSVIQDNTCSKFVLS